MKAVVVVFFSSEASLCIHRLTTVIVSECFFFMHETKHLHYPFWTLFLDIKLEHMVKVCDLMLLLLYSSKLCFYLKK
ncbi:BnaC05g03890D [Brassica napus]|uniref:(rape) hypothetical protein n=1 Tax=Brassica napus TaxID=3708 RepID=A0A078F9V7_BRANA|nr:unnamed protein product [Brassica napus]CDY10146.1 BnaC05g03890D [Brassica napus]